MDILQPSKLQELTWSKVRAEVKRVNPTLAKLIDQIDPGPEYTLFKLSCPFGTEILRQGKLLLPNENGVATPLEELSSVLQEKLGYNLYSNPVGLILKKSAELFLNLEDRTIPFYGLVPTGKIFGTWRLVDLPTYHHPAFLWNMTAGARSIFMLPKITEQTSHNRLRQVYHLSAEKPKKLLDHWEIFRQIANSNPGKNHWQMEILFFSKIWFEKLKDPAWIVLYNYLLETAWANSEFWRNEFVWDLMFSIIQKRKKIKPSPHIADIVKHLLAIGVGAVPGVIPANNEEAAPISLLREAYLDVYRLKHYVPTIMQPALFDMHSNSSPVYYSLQYPSAIEFSQKSSDRSTVIADLYAAKSLLNKYISDIREQGFNLEATGLYDMAHKVKYDFYHSGTEKYYELRENAEIPKDDKRFLHDGSGNDREFPTASSFVLGCVRVSKACE